MKQYINKVPGGKLLKVKLSIENDKIAQIQILGDFFMHPEEGVFKIEEGLLGNSKEEILDSINNAIENDKIKIMGFKAEDLNELIQKGFEDEV